MPFGGYFPGWSRIFEIIIIVVVIIAIFHDPTGSAHWVQQRAHNGADIIHQATVFIQSL
jgi:hypothetical protein